MGYAKLTPALVGLLAAAEGAGAPASLEPASPAGATGRLRTGNAGAFWRPLGKSVEPYEVAAYLAEGWTCPTFEQFQKLRREFAARR